MSDRPALIARGLAKSFGGAQIVSDVSLTLKPRQITALLGPSGAGKSTVLRLLAGLEVPDAGEIYLGDERLSQPGKAVAPEKRGIGLIFQDFALFPHMTAVENVRFGLSHLPKAEGIAQSLAWLERLGLAQRARAYPHQLSGGEQQRVAIARALAPGPGALLMDEPFSGLDPALRDEVADITLAAVREAGVPALLVSHDAGAAMASADQLAIMRGGMIVQTGTPSDVYDAPVDAETAAALGPVTRLTARDLPAQLRPVDCHDGDQLCLRTEAVVLADGGVPAMVETVLRQGAVVRVQVRVGNATLPVLLPRTHLPEAGDTLEIALDPAATFVFQS